MRISDLSSDVCSSDLGSAFLCNQDLGQVLNLVFFPDRVIEVEHQPATDEAPRRIAGDRQIVRCEPVGAFWGENEPVLTLELGPDWLTLNYLFEDDAGDHAIQIGRASCRESMCQDV